MTDIVVALIGAAALIASVTMPIIITRRVGSKVDAVHDEVRTNHGMRAGDYLEKVADLQVEVAAQGKVLTHLAQAWGDHTVSDAVSFKEINDRLEVLAERRGTPRRKG